MKAKINGYELEGNVNEIKQLLDLDFKSKWSNRLVVNNYVEKPKTKKRKHHKYTKEEINKIMIAHKKGMTGAEIGELTGHSTPAIYNLIYRNQNKIKRNKYY